MRGFNPTDLVTTAPAPAAAALLKDGPDNPRIPAASIVGFVSFNPAISVTSRLDIKMRLYRSKVISVVKIKVSTEQAEKNR